MGPWKPWTDSLGAGESEGCKTWVDGPGARESGSWGPAENGRRRVLTGARQEGDNGDKGESPPQPRQEGDNENISLPKAMEEEGYKDRSLLEARRQQQRQVPSGGQAGRVKATKATKAAKD